MTSVAAYSYTMSVTYVADNILKSFKDIIRLSGLDPTALVESWESTMLALTTWLRAGTLTGVVLEVFNPATNALVGRWDVDVVYGAAGDGSFWTDTDQIKYHIQKAGLWPSQCRYSLILQNKPGRPDVPGWGPGGYRSTVGFARQSLGTTIEHNGLGANAAYWRKVG